MADTPANPLATQPPPQQTPPAGGNSESWETLFNEFRSQVKANNPKAIEYQKKIFADNPSGLTRKKFAAELSKVPGVVPPGMTITGLDDLIQKAAPQQQAPGLLDKAMSAVKEHFMGAPQKPAEAAKPAAPAPKPQSKTSIPKFAPGQPNVPQRAWRNNNPGNLHFANQPGATPGEDGFAKFDTPEAGFAAIKDQIALDAGRGMTVDQYIAKYAPPTENDTKGYLARIHEQLGIKEDAPLDSINPEKLARLQEGIESSSKNEEAKPQQAAAPKAEPPKKAEQPGILSRVASAANKPLLEGAKPYTAKIGEMGKGHGPAAEFSAGFAQGIAETGIDMTSLTNVGLMAGATLLGGEEYKAAVSGLPKALKILKWAPQIIHGTFSAAMWDDIGKTAPGALEAYTKGDYKTAGQLVSRALSDAFLIKTAHDSRIARGEKTLTGTVKDAAVGKAKEMLGGKKTAEPPTAAHLNAVKRMFATGPATEAKPDFESFRRKNFILRNGKLYPRGEEFKGKPGYTQEQVQHHFETGEELPKPEEAPKKAAKPKEEPAADAPKATPKAEEPGGLTVTRGRGEKATEHPLKFQSKIDELAYRISKGEATPEQVEEAKKLSGRTRKELVRLGDNDIRVNRIAAKLQSLKPGDTLTVPKTITTAEELAAKNEAAKKATAAANKKAPEKESLKKVGDMGKGITDSMYDMLWGKAQKGDITEAGQKSPILQAAKILKDAGKLNSRDDLKSLAQEVAKAQEDKANFQSRMKEIVNKRLGTAESPKATPAKPAAPKIDFKDSKLTATSRRLVEDIVAKKITDPKKLVDAIRSGAADKGLDNEEVVKIGKFMKQRMLAEIDKPKAKTAEPPAKPKAAAEIPDNVKAAQERMKARLAKLKSERGSVSNKPISEEDRAMLNDLYTIGKHYVTTGAKDFGKWSKQMVDDFGDTIKEHLKPVWDKIQERSARSIKPATSEADITKDAGFQKLSPAAKSIIRAIDTGKPEVAARYKKANPGAYDEAKGYLAGGKSKTEVPKTKEPPKQEAKPEPIEPNEAYDERQVSKPLPDKSPRIHHELSKRVPDLDEFYKKSLDSDLLKQQPKNVQALHRRMAQLADDEQTYDTTLATRKDPVRNAYRKYLDKAIASQPKPLSAKEATRIKEVAPEDPDIVVNWLVDKKGFTREQAETRVKPYTEKPITKTAPPPEAPKKEASPQLPQTAAGAIDDTTALKVAQVVTDRFARVTSDPRHYPLELTYRDGAGKEVGKFTVKSPREMDDARLDIAANVSEGPVASIDYKAGGGKGTIPVKTALEESEKVGLKGKSTSKKTAPPPEREAAEPDDPFGPAGAMAGEEEATKPEPEKPKGKVKAEDLALPNKGSIIKEVGGGGSYQYLGISDDPDTKGWIKARPVTGGLLEYILPEDWDKWRVIKPADSRLNFHNPPEFVGG